MRIAIGIEYDGTGYNGWQRQTSGVGIQQRLEEALSRVADHPIEAVCAGRTDAGVHATGQVAHFDTHSDRTPRSWLLGTNSNLPDDICVSWAQPVAEGFHARYTATSRRYEYRILNRLQRSALHRHRAWWVHEPLDAQRMQDAARALIGEHDFSAYRAAGCQSRTAIREVTALDVVRDDDWLTIGSDGECLPATHGSQHRRDARCNRPRRRGTRLGSRSSGEPRPHARRHGRAAAGPDPGTCRPIPPNSAFHDGACRSGFSRDPGAKERDFR